MKICFDQESNLCWILLGIACLPLLHSLIGYLQHRYQASFHSQREQYDKIKLKYLLNTFALGLKLAILITLIVLSCFQVLLNQIYHQDYQIITLIEAAIIANSALQFLFFMYDAYYYGHTTIITRINLTVQSLSFIIFAVVIYTFEATKPIDRGDVCWIIFLIRGSLQFAFTIGLFIQSSDKTLIHTITTEYQFNFNASLSSEASKEPLLETRQHQNISVYTFNGGAQNRINHISVQTFKESQKYEKRTIIYQINYTYEEKKEKLVYRSFREFIYFHNDLKLEFPEATLPCFPMRKDSNRMLSSEDLEARRKCLDDYMQGVAENPMVLEDDQLLRKFLNADSNVPNYIAKHPLQRSTQRKQSPGAHSISKGTLKGSFPETIFEGTMEEEDDERDETVNKRKSRMKTYQPQPMESKPSDVIQHCLSLDLDREQDAVIESPYLGERPNGQKLQERYFEEEKNSHEDMKLP